MYTTQTQLEALIPPKHLREALDDDADGVADAGLLEEIIRAAGTRVDAALGQRYAVPFSDPLPAIVSHAAKVFVLESLYRRRGLADENNPWVAQASALDKQLMAIGKGEAPLTPDIIKKRPPASVISAPSKIHDPAGRILS